MGCWDDQHYSAVVSDAFSEVNRGFVKSKSYDGVRRCFAGTYVRIRLLLDYELESIWVKVNPFFLSFKPPVLTCSFSPCSRLHVHAPGPEWDEKVQCSRYLIYFIVKGVRSTFRDQSNRRINPLTKYKKIVKDLESSWMIVPEGKVRQI